MDEPMCNACLIYTTGTVGCQLITNHGNSIAAKQGLRVSLPVALAYLPVAPLPARGDYTLCLSV